MSGPVVPYAPLPPFNERRCVACLEVHTREQPVQRFCRCQEENGLYHYTCVVRTIIATLDNPCPTCNQRFQHPDIVRDYRSGPLAYIGAHYRQVAYTSGLLANSATVASFLSLLGHQNYNPFAMVAVGGTLLFGWMTFVGEELVEELRDFTNNGIRWMQRRDQNSPRIFFHRFDPTGRYQPGVDYVHMIDIRELRAERDFDFLL